MGLFRRRAPADGIEIVYEEAQRLVVPGFTPLADARAAIREMVEDDEGLRVGPARAEAILDEVWARRVREQGSWRQLSDADRLDAAFAELEAGGIVARMAFSCCGSCGAQEIHGEVPDGVSARGYVFFHAQDADGLAEPDPHLYLSYGAFTDDAVADDEYEREAVAVGHAIRRALEANGLRVTWDGTHARRIGVAVPDWRRRLPA